MKGEVHSEEPDANNKYNQNFQNRFCDCECDYDPFMQKGTMFQCLGLGTTEDGGCGEDWWHPGCIVGLGPDWLEDTSHKGTSRMPKSEGFLESITEVSQAVVGESNADASASVSGNAPPSTAEPGEEDEEDENEDMPLPLGFPHEDDFEGFICYKCVEAHPWIKRYAGAQGFLEPVFRRSAAPSPETGSLNKTEELITSLLPVSKKRKADEDADSVTSSTSKRVKESDDVPGTNGMTSSPSIPLKTENACKARALPSAPLVQLSLFFKSDFRDHFCRCSDCFTDLSKHPQLLEEEENYEPPFSEDGEEGGGSTVGSASIYDRGESALKNVDRVRAIEGVMAYNHLKEKLRPLFQEFAGSGKALGAEDIKAYFAKLRGDDQAIKEAGEGAQTTDSRREQSGY